LKKSKTFKPSDVWPETTCIVRKSAGAQVEVLAEDDEEIFWH